MLHIFSMAGVAEQLCKYGAGDKVLQLSKLDEFGFGEFYGMTEYFDNMNDLIKRGMELEPEYDKVVIHFFPKFAFHFTPSKVVYMFHGSDIREKPKEYLEQFEDKNCFVTTVDLLEILPTAKLCPNTVDLEHFVNNDIEEGDDWVKEIDHCVSALKAYISHYGMETFTVEAVEQTMYANIGPYQVTGRADLIIRDRQGKVWIVDHKTTSRINNSQQKLV